MIEPGTGKLIDCREDTTVQSGCNLFLSSHVSSSEQAAVLTAALPAKTAAAPPRRTTYRMGVTLALLPSATAPLSALPASEALVERAVNRGVRTGGIAA